jgi:hypothetical protein
MAFRDNEGLRVEGDGDEDKEKATYGMLRRN